MNIFTTEHPFDSQTMRSMSRKARAARYFGNILLAVLFSLPFLIAYGWYLNLTDINTTDYTPDPFWVVVVEAAIESLVVAFVCVSLYWLAAWYFRRLRQVSPLHS